MQETHDFLVPDYFKHFSCKMGACRAACCQGWPISITMKNYFTLLGTDCSAELRGRLDRSMYLVDRPTEDEYARFSMRYDGECALRLPDGRCGVHAELGTEVLSDVCDLYPRGVRTIPGYECSCAASCEAVLELLIRHREPIAFAHETRTLRMPRKEKRSAYFETHGRETDIRLWFIRMMQDRSQTIPQRLICLGENVQRMEKALQEKDAAKVDALLNIPQNMGNVLFAETADAVQPTNALEAVEEFVEFLDERSDSLRERGEAVLAYFKSADDVLEQYKTAKAHFETAFPDWGIFCEHMLVNHMFFSQFPFQSRSEKLTEEFIALCAVYVLLRFLMIGGMAEKDNETELIDLCASIFRLVEHTDFDRLAIRLLHTLDFADMEMLWTLVNL